MITHEEIKKLLSIIESCLKGEGDDSIVNEVWGEYDQEFVEDPLLGDAWSELTHFMDDSDIRKNDAEYAEYQKNKLNKYMEDIKKKYLV